MQRLRAWASAVVVGAMLLAPAAHADVAERRDERDCGIRQVGTERGIGALFLLIGLAAFGWSRRRRS
ncbi:MAG TPA: hypothetical protein VHP33_12220 [Polyangiaceae bacterium]|nr:hypothetical protein [Polyangiaceae bacterium]